MHFFTRLSIATKIILISSLLAALFLGVSFGYAIINFRTELITSTENLAEHEVLDEVEKIEISTTGIKNTIFALSGTPPIQGIIRARENNGYDREETSTIIQWQKRLAAIFSAEMSSTNYYDQLRYLDEQGNELVRVNNNNGTPTIVPSDQLQNKSNRAYFIEAMTLTTGEIYISKVELNREGTPPMLSKPYRPVIRYAVPVFDEITGKRKGILIANVLVKKIISLNVPINDKSLTSYIINPQGYYIEHPDDTKEWGGANDLNTGYTFFTEYPGITAKNFSESVGSFVNNDDIFVSSHVFANAPGEEQWTIIRKIPLPVLFAPIDTIAEIAIRLGFVTYIILLFIFIFVVKKLLFPLQNLATAAEKIGQGNFDLEIPITSQDEVGKLALVFKRMASQLKTLYGNLEQKVRERTQQLEDEKNKTSTILASIGEGMIATDNTGSVILINQAFSDILGWQEQEVLGKKIQEILSIEDENHVQIANDKRPLTIALQTRKKISNTNMFYIKKNGEKVPVEITINPVSLNGKLFGTIEVFRDISKEKEVDKMKTEFLSLASHQLRTPLSAMRWFLETLLDQSLGKLPEKQEEIVSKVQQSNNRMIELVNALLNVSRLEQGRIMVEPQPTDLKKLLQEVLSDITPKITEKKQQIVSHLPEKELVVSIDPKLIRQVYLNLISNAIKYSPEESTIDLSLSIKGPEVLFSVTDTGYGIPQDEQPKIFEKFFRASNVATKETDGNGLGLYLIKQIVEVSGGKIWFTSVEGKGSTFSFTIPLTGSKLKQGEKGLEE